MVCKSFYCHRCGKSINIHPSRQGDPQGAIRQHYWDHHRPTMMKGIKKRKKQGKPERKWKNIKAPKEYIIERIYITHKKDQATINFKKK